MEPVIGIDLGTTNSEVAFIFDGTTQIITDNDNGILPSCVSIGENGNIIVGAEAGNQALINPERTVLSVKRHMGTDQKFQLGTLSFSPQEISAFILKELKERAEKKINCPVSKAIITVPAYFTDTQRQATREACEIAGLEVARIINEPTAAALAYESVNPETQRVLVYDLGGGTFDVSIVRIEDGVVEVLSSTGDNHLGGDDFDLKIVDHLAKHMETEFDYSVKDKPAVMARLKRAAEGAKIQLSSVPYVTIEEDHIGKKGGKDLHLSLELSRADFEEMIEEDLVRTMESVNKALKDAAMLPSAIDKIILVGGSTRIPRISQMLEEKIGHLPHSEIDPDMCVAIGAGMQAGREMGMERSGVLVDITPYTFGTSAMGEVDDEPSETMFVPLIRRNTKLPASKSEAFYTMYDNQEAVDVKIYQGEAPDALDNIQLGNYLFNLTDAPSGSAIILHFDLDLNGILKIKAVEKKTGNKINAVIENAIPRFTDEELSQTQDRINGLWTEGRESETSLEENVQTNANVKKLPPEYAEIVKRAEEKLTEASEDDRDEMINLMEDIRDAVMKNKMEDAEAFKTELDEILFYMG
ncbi:MAG: Hsp70 family protein [Deltaproteobacteria bacterium]|nr:Hsp70 family protein [Deltaproteobacteria bacterium]MBW2660832.1 Hsp70 family protein [Deltaproteobacteria bacterium]